MNRAKKLNLPQIGAKMGKKFTTIRKNKESKYDRATRQIVNAKGGRVKRKPSTGIGVGY